MMCMNERVRRQNDLNGEKTIIMEEKKESVIRVKNLYKIYQVGTNKVYALNGVDFTMSVRLRQVHSVKYAGRAGEAHQGRDHHSRKAYGADE